VVGLGIYLALPKHPTIEGCVETMNGVSRITNGNDNQGYELVGSYLRLKAGHRLKLQGKKQKNKSSSRQFTVKRVVEDKGPVWRNREGLNSG
jgi:hypothetical protein